MDRRRRAADGSLAGRHPPLRPRCTATTTWVRDAHARSLRQALHAWPGRTRSMTAGGRCASRRSIARLKAQGAVFGSKLGWERPNWFAPRRRRAATTSIRSAGRTGSTRSAREHRAVPRGGGAVRPDLVRQVHADRARRRAALSWICANDVAQAAGLARLHADAQPRGGIECDLTVVAASPRTRSTSSPAPASPRTTSPGSRATFPTGCDARADRRDVGLCACCR